MANVTLAEIRAAAVRLRGVAGHTPLLRSRYWSELTGGDVFLKAECLQRTGSFKVRGATNMIAQLTPAERARGVIAVSAGNHAQGVAVAARAAGIPAVVVMPEGAALAKVEATKGYGATVIQAGRTFAAAAEAMTRLAAERGLTIVPPFDDPRIIAGQGTLGLEIAAEAPDVDLVVCPVGADGIAVATPGALTLPYLLENVDEILAVDEEMITRAMVLLLERAKLVVEGAGAVGVAALTAGLIRPRGGKVVVILSGGNVDLNLLGRIVEHGLAQAGRYLVIRVAIPDCPGQLARLLALVGEAGANVLDVDHRRSGAQLSFGSVEVELLLETRNAAHAGDVGEALERAGYQPVAQLARPALARSFSADDVIV